MAPSTRSVKESKYRRSSPVRVTDFISIRRDFMHNSGREIVISLGIIDLDESQLVQICRRYGVRELFVFGSAARGIMRPDSDFDLLVEFLPEAQPGLLDHAGLMLDLSELLGRKVDLVS